MRRRSGRVERRRRRRALSCFCLCSCKLCPREGEEESDRWARRVCESLSWPIRISRAASCGRLAVGLCARPLEPGRTGNKWPCLLLLAQASKLAQLRSAGLFSASRPHARLEARLEFSLVPTRTCRRLISWLARVRPGAPERKENEKKSWQRVELAKVQAKKGAKQVEVNSNLQT